MKAYITIQQNNKKHKIYLSDIKKLYKNYKNNRKPIPNYCSDEIERKP